MFRNDSVLGRFLNLVADILCIGILWLICSLSIVTAGAATTAAYYAMAKSVRGKTGYIWKEFFRALKSNLRQSLPLTITYEVILAILVLDIIYVWNNDNTMNSALFMVLCLIGFVFAGVVVYSAPLLSRFVTNNLNLFRMAVIVTFRYLPITIAILVIGVVAGIGIYLMPWTIFVIPGVYLYGLTFPVEWIMKKIMPPAEEVDEEAKKWYYQN